MIKNLVFVLWVLLTFSSPVLAQTDNSKWTVDAKKIKGDNYEIVFHLKLEKDWHIYSMNPGDSSLIPPSFEIDKNPNVTLVGKITEAGKMTTEKMEGIDGMVNRFSGEVTYSQKATIKGKPTITGNYTYQICTNQMCLAPNTKKFSFKVK